MTDYQKYINALRKCANEHENDRTFTGNIIVSDLCRDTANLLEELSSSEKPNNSEIPTSSITKNCESCRYYGSHHEVCNYCYKCSLWTEQEPTTKNDCAVDCISREATVKRFCNLAEFLNEHKENSGAPYIMAALFIQDNKTEFPSVTPIRPKGHWIEVLGGCKCSRCDMAFSKLKETCADNYCPNCGTKMESEG